MLLNQRTWAGIASGEIDLAFRRWRKPTVKTGGRLRSGFGELAIDEVEVIERADIDDDQARRAGFPSAAELIDDLFRRRSGSGRGRTAHVDETSLLYRVRFHLAGPDPRAARRETLLEPDELDGVLTRLAAIDVRSDRGPWTLRSLVLIRRWPERRAPELAEMEGCETLPWKAQIRRLKDLGLTESMRVGYRLSPRGVQVLGEAERRGFSTELPD